LEGNTSAFGDVDFLDEDPVLFVFGARRTWERSALEVGLGTALDRDAAAQLLFDVAFVVRF
jgi:hypothetical protein